MCEQCLKIYRDAERRIGLIAMERDALRAEVKTLKQKELVLYDLHDALGVKWGDDPYAVINKMKSEVLYLTEKLGIAEGKVEALTDALPSDL